MHVGAQDESTLLITFMWTMGWYQFRVELADAGRITLADRGYEERVDLRPNASARTDGTVQLAPSQIKPPTPKDTSEAKPGGRHERRDHLEVDDGPAHRRRERAGRLEVASGPPTSTGDADRRPRVTSGSRAVGGAREPAPAGAGRSPMFESRSIPPCPARQRRTGRSSSVLRGSACAGGMTLTGSSRAAQRVRRRRRRGRSRPASRSRRRIAAARRPCP